MPTGVAFPYNALMLNDAHWVFRWWSLVARSFVRPAKLGHSANWLGGPPSTACPHSWDSEVPPREHQERLTSLHTLEALGNLARRSPEPRLAIDDTLENPGSLRSIQATADNMHGDESPCRHCRN